MAGEDVVDAENLMVNEALDKIKKAPAGEHGANQSPAPRGGITLAGGAEQHRRACQSYEPESQVKEAILRVL